MICSSCGRESHIPACSICYRELAATSREWAEENIILHRQVKALQAEVERLKRDVRGATEEVARVRDAADNAEDQVDALTAEVARLRAALEDIACGAWVQRYEALRIARDALSQGAVKGAVGQTAVADSAVISDA